MVSSTHKALTPHMGFSRACSSSDTAVSADSGGRGVSPAGGHHFRFQTQVVGAPVTPLLSDLDPFSEVRWFAPAAPRTQGSTGSPVPACHSGPPGDARDRGPQGRVPAAVPFVVSRPPPGVLPAPRLRDWWLRPLARRWPGPAVPALGSGWLPWQSACVPWGSRQEQRLHEREGLVPLTGHSGNPQGSSRSFVPETVDRDQIALYHGVTAAYKFPNILVSDYLEESSEKWGHLQSVG